MEARGRRLTINNPSASYVLFITVIMSPRDSTLFNLNEAASAIWEAADGLTPLQQIVEQHVCAAFDVTPEEAMKDAESFVKELATHGILKLSQEPIQI